MLDKRYPGPQRICRQVLSNGVTILALESRAIPTVVIEGIVHAGAILDGRDMAGLASFTADMLMRGTKQNDFTQIFERLESVGAGLSFDGGRHVTQFSGVSLVDDVDLLIDLLVQSLRMPAFPSEHVERLRGQIQTDFQMRANDTRRIAGLNFMETLYRDHPYGRSIQGYPETVDRIEVHDLVDFHAQNYGPRGMIVALVGSIKTSEAVAKVAAYLGDWECHSQAVLSDVKSMTRPKELVMVAHEMPAKTQSDLILGLPGPRRSEPDYLHASLVNTVLGVFGMMGRIGRVVREELGLAYHASSHLAGGPGPSPWTVEAGTRPECVAQVIESIRQEISRIQNELVPHQELDDCKSFRVGSLPVGLETHAALAATLLDMEFYDLGLDYLQRFPHLMRNISAEQVRSAAQKYLSPDQFVVSVAGPVSGGDVCRGIQEYGEPLTTL
ncbi:MAG: pitrilysin family protein [Candidatus Promineifilaceae bacterium]|nr:pitrilysin family protein [Candidatus Promineifilaceae bacterium]